MNIRGSFPLQACFTFFRKAIASKPLLPKETQTAITFSSTAIHFRLFFSVDPSNKSFHF